MRAVDIIRRLYPKARREYLLAFEQGDAELAEAGIYKSQLRLAHFLAQCAHECYGFTIVRENMSYRAARIMQIFGVGKHSARVTRTEASRLAGKPYDLAERVYGLGNPRKAKELGNHRKGDGFLFRGASLLQATGGWQFKRLAQLRGVDFFTFPDKLVSPEHALFGAIEVWTRRNLNEAADRNDIRAITKAINGGLNGFNDRVRQFNRIWPLLEKQPSWKIADANQVSADVQSKLAQLGYNVEIDGRQGPETTNAIRQFQKDEGIKPDGIADTITIAHLDTRVRNLDADNSREPDDIFSDGVFQASGGGMTGTGLAGEQVIQAARQAQYMIGDAPILSTIFAVITVVGVGLIVYPILRKAWRNRTVQPI